MQSAAVAIITGKNNIKQLGLNFSIPVTERRQAGQKTKPTVTHTGMFLYCFLRPLNCCCPHNLTVSIRQTGFFYFMSHVIPSAGSVLAVCHVGTLSQILL